MCFFSHVSCLILWHVFFLIGELSFIVAYVSFFICEMSHIVACFFSYVSCLLLLHVFFLDGTPTGPVSKNKLLQIKRLIFILHALLKFVVLVVIVHIPFRWRFKMI